MFPKKAADKALFTFLIAGLLALLACEENEREVESESENGAKRMLQSGETAPGDRGSAEGLRGKLIAGLHPGPERNMLHVPTTDFFPGEAYISPSMANPYSEDTNAISAGKRHFAAFNCSGCHAPKGGGGMGPALSDNSWIYGDDPAQIYLSIAQGRPNGMPAWGAMLPEKTIWELVAYVDTLSGAGDSAQ